MVYLADDDPTFEVETLFAIQSPTLKALAGEDF